MTTTLDTNYLALASKLAYECETCEGNGTILKATAQDDGHPWLEEDFCVCPACDHGKVYPLREKCDERHGSHDGNPHIAGHHPENCSYCKNRGWVLVPLHLETLIAAGAKCGILIPVNASNLKEHGLLAERQNNYVSAFRAFDPTDPASILAAAVKALLEVV